MKTRKWLLIMLVILMAGTALAEASEAAHPLTVTEELALEDFTISVDSSWIIDHDEDAEGMALSAKTVDNLSSLSIFLVGDGSDEQVREIAAVNEYAEGVARGGSEEINGIKMIFAAKQDPKAAYVYFSANDHVYTMSMSTSDPELAVETLQERLEELALSITLNPIE